MRELFANVGALCILVSIVFTGCKSETPYAYESGPGVKAIVYQIQSQFGLKAGYATIHMRKDDSVGLVLTITGISERNKDSLVVYQLQNTNWKQLASTPLNTLAEKPFLFTMESIGDMKLLPDLIKTSFSKMMKGDQDPGLQVKEVLINVEPFDPENDPLRYNIYVQPKNGFAKVEFTYNMKGELKSTKDY